MNKYFLLAIFLLIPFTSFAAPAVKSDPAIIKIEAKAIPQATLASKYLILADSTPNTPVNNEVSTRPIDSGPSLGPAVVSDNSLAINQGTGGSIPAGNPSFEIRKIVRKINYFLIVFTFMVSILAFIFGMFQIFFLYKPDLLSPSILRLIWSSVGLILSFLALLKM